VSNERSSGSGGYLAQWDYCEEPLCSALTDGIFDDKSADACGCPPGQGWHTRADPTKSKCRAGGETSSGEATFCRQAALGVSCKIDSTTQVSYLCEHGECKEATSVIGQQPCQDATVAEIIAGHTCTNAILVASFSGSVEECARLVAHSAAKCGDLLHYSGAGCWCVPEGQKCNLNADVDSTVQRLSCVWSHWGPCSNPDGEGLSYRKALVGTCEGNTAMQCVGNIHVQYTVAPSIAKDPTPAPSATTQPLTQDVSGSYGRTRVVFAFASWLMLASSCRSILEA
jgi:hypothetical protein